MTRVNRVLDPPSGLEYVAGFVDASEMQAMVRNLETIDYRQVVMRGVAAKRTVIHYGWDYAYEAWKIEPADPMPDYVQELRDRAAARFGLGAEDFEQVLVARYPPGAGIGWHRDAPMFGATVLGLSLGSDCEMLFRRKSEAGYDHFRLPLEDGSLYAIGGEARMKWQHSITRTPGLRYSITFRTVKKGFKKVAAGH